jgi:hypothetical protein
MLPRLYRLGCLAGIGSVTMYKIVEKNNPLAVHCLCDTLESAHRWLAVNAVEYCEKGYFMNKSLTPDDFMIVSYK